MLAVVDRNVAHLPELRRMQFLGIVLRNLERAMGIEPTAPAWEAGVLPLYDARF